MPLSGKQMVKLLSENGWRLLRINGSHHVMMKPGVARSISVPVHGNQTLPTGTEKSILKQAGLK